MTRAESSPMNARPYRPHRMLGLLAGLLACASLIGTIARALPENWQALPYVPVIVSLTPWFIVVSALALVLALASHRWGVALLMTLCLCLQVWWQLPFFAGSPSAPGTAPSAVSTADTARHANTPVVNTSASNTADAYARVMTVNVFKGQADPKTIVDLVRNQHVEVLTMQETTADFVEKLDRAGIGSYLPYSQISSSDGVYGNGIWSASALTSPVDDEINSSASFMPAGTVAFNGGRTPVRFVSVHTTSPKPGEWSAWNRSIAELGRTRSRTGVRYVLMGDFNATTDHAVFRSLLANRFRDATRSAGHGFTFTWPANRPGIPAFAGIDHMVIDTGISADRMQAVHVPGSDHKALLGTLNVQ